MSFTDRKVKELAQDICKTCVAETHCELDSPCVTCLKEADQLIELGYTKNPLDNLLIISNYDSGFGFSAMVDGIAIDTTSALIFTLRDKYNDKPLETFVKYCFKE